MDIDRIVHVDTARGGRAARRWFSDTLAMLVIIDVMAFAAAGWLVLQIPEAFERAANSANPVVVFAGSNPACPERRLPEAPVGAIKAPTS